jgi:predicted transcriptional regulator
MTETITETITEQELQAIQGQWDTFTHAVNTIGVADYAGFQRINMTIGFNLAKAVPALLLVIQRQEERIENLKAGMAQQAEAGDKLKEEFVKVKRVSDSQHERIRDLENINQALRQQALQEKKP